MGIQLVDHTVPYILIHMNRYSMHLNENFYTHKFTAYLPPAALGSQHLDAVFHHLQEMSVDGSSGPVKWPLRPQLCWDNLGYVDIGITGMGLVIVMLIQVLRWQGANDGITMYHSRATTNKAISRWASAVTIMDDEWGLHDCTTQS